MFDSRIWRLPLVITILVAAMSVFGDSQAEPLEDYSDTGCIDSYAFTYRMDSRPFHFKHGGQFAVDLDQGVYIFFVWREAKSNNPRKYTFTLEALVPRSEYSVEFVEISPMEKFEPSYIERTGRFSAVYRVGAPYSGLHHFRVTPGDYANYKTAVRYFTDPIHSTRCHSLIGAYSGGGFRLD